MIATALILIGLSVFNSVCIHDIKKVVRVLVCSVASYASFKAYSLQKTGLSWLLGTIAVMYFPLFISRLFHQSGWFYVHALIGVVLIAGAYCFSDSDEPFFRRIVHDLDEMAKRTKFPFVRQVVIICAIGLLYVLVSGPKWCESAFKTEDTQSENQANSNVGESETTQQVDETRSSDEILRSLDTPQ